MSSMSGNYNTLVQDRYNDLEAVGQLNPRTGDVIIVQDIDGYDDPGSNVVLSDEYSATDPIDIGADCFTLMYNGVKWVVVNHHFHSGRHDKTTQIENVSALTSADRGLSLGQAQKPRTRPATVAELDQANADQVSFDAWSMQQLMTNRAEDPLGGMMNADGTMGWFEQLNSASILQGNGWAVSEAILDPTHNGGCCVIGGAGGNNQVYLGPPKYDYQMMRIWRLPQTTEYTTTINCINGASLRGLVRRPTDNAIALSAGETSCRLRIGESLLLKGIGLAWWVVDHYRHHYNGASYQEQPDGTYDFFIRANASGFAVGQIFGVSFPFAISNQNNLFVSFGEFEGATATIGQQQPVGSLSRNYNYTYWSTASTSTQLAVSYDTRTGETNNPSLFNVIVKGARRA